MSLLRPVFAMLLPGRQNTASSGGQPARRRDPLGEGGSSVLSSLTHSWQGGTSASGCRGDAPSSPASRPHPSVTTRVTASTARPRTRGGLWPTQPIFLKWNFIQFF